MLPVSVTWFAGSLPDCVALLPADHFTGAGKVIGWRDRLTIFRGYYTGVD